MREPTASYHIVRVENDLVYCVDADTRREVWDWIQEWSSEEYSDLLDITTLDGGDVTLIRGKVLSLEESTPEIRDFNRRHQKLLDLENPFTE